MRTEVEDAVERVEEWLAPLSGEPYTLGVRPLILSSFVCGVGEELPEIDAADIRTVLAALRAQAERVRVLEGERDDTLVRWCARMAEIREASGVGMNPMLDEVPGAIAERIAAAEARAEAAERRAGELEGALRKIAFPPKGSSGPSLAGCIEIAARALLPATQAEGE